MAHTSAYRCLVPARRAPAFARRPAQTLWIGPGHHLVHYPIQGGEGAAAVKCPEKTGRPGATRLQELSRGRQETNHLPDGPAQRARDASFASEDPLARYGWIYGYDAELDLREALASGPCRECAG